MSFSVSSNHKINDDYIKIFAKLQKEGRSIKEISERFRVGETTIRKSLKKYHERLKSS